MTKMMAVRCPACSERVEGSSSLELSKNLRTHFSDIHNYEPPSTGTMLSSPASPSSEELRGGADMLREGERPSPEERAPSKRRPAPTPGGGIGPGASEDTSDVSSFQCPMCGSEISGESEEELSSRFRSHLTSTHREEPFVTRLMEKVGSR